MDSWLFNLIVCCEKHQQKDYVTATVALYSTINNGHSCTPCRKKWIHGGNFRQLLTDLQTSFTDRE